MKIQLVMAATNCPAINQDTLMGHYYQSIRCLNVQPPREERTRH